MRARMADVQDIGNRLLHALNQTQASFSPFPEKGGVAAARYFLPSQVLELCAQGVQGFLAQEGSRSSHAAILMRMLGGARRFGAGRFLQPPVQRLHRDSGTDLPATC